MKKYFTYFVCISIAVAGCRKESEPIFNQSPDERLNEALQRYQQVLTGAPHGWNATLETAIGITFGFYFRFNDSNRVVMYSDFDSVTASVSRESSYRLKALQQPSLLFDTYSYIHLLADPDARVNGGFYGSGLVSDFEFSIDSVTEDHISLTGRFNQSKATLKKATAQDQAAWQNKLIQQAQYSLKSLDKILHYFKRLTYEGMQYEIRVDTLFKQIRFNWIDASGNAQTVTTGYYYVPGGIAFTHPVGDITGFTTGAWNGATGTLQVQVGGKPGSVAGAIQPIHPDTQAGKRWWQMAVDLGRYWFSPNGFHVNGMDDAFNLRSLQTDTSRYYYLVYWPGIQPQTGPAFDVLTPFFYFPAFNALDLYYGTAQNIEFRTDGKVLFRYLGDLTVGEYPASGPAHQTRVQLYDSYGYWFVQTGENTFDMVSAKDAKTWASWRL
jgi:hypothetical protein